jgi:hypothetical protein
MVPETPLELCQLNTVGLPPDGVDPVPVPIVVQPAAIVAITEAIQLLNLNRHFYTPRVDSLATIGRRTVALRPGVYFCEAAATIVFSCSMAASSARLRQAPSSPIHCSRG